MRPETYPVGLCVHCDALVFPGRDCLVRPSGIRVHRGCWELAIVRDRRGVFERRAIFWMFVCIAACLLAMALVEAARG